MRPAKLFTADGGFVVEGMVPYFMDGREAQVLTWGSRTFLLKKQNGAALVDGTDNSLAYFEVFAIALVIVKFDPENNG